MKARSLAVFALFLAPYSAAAQGVPAARIEALLAGEGRFSGLSLPPLASPRAPAARALALQAPDSLVPAGLWATLAAPDAATLATLTHGIPGLQASAVRTLTPEAAEGIFAAAVARGYAGLDLFTDAGFRGDEVYYLPQSLIAALFDRYEMRVLTPASGTTNKGQAFHMTALVIGRGRIDALYDQDKFSFDNPYFTDGRYKLDGHVTEVIQGPGDLTIQGVSIHVKIFQPTIQRIVKLSPDSARVETSMGSRVKGLRPIRRR
jgi:hypothetical protein